ncbi:hypothetical protein V2O64_11780 [Verrucomicrobiaceae bacterium 227]
MMTKINGLTALACAFAMIGQARAERPRAGTVESELAIQGGILDGVSMRLDRKKVELETYRKYQEIAAEIAEGRTTLATIKKEIADLESQKIMVGDDLSSVQLSFEEYRDQYRKSERLAAVGEILDLSKIKDDSYQESKVLGISPLHLRVSRPTGTEGIPFKDLPTSIQDRFQFSEIEAAEYASKMAKSDAARAKAFNQWKAGQNQELPGVTSTNKNERLVQMETLSQKTREESLRLRKLSDEWREKAARYWKGISAAKTQASQKSRERIASRAEGKADQYFELSRVARFEADRLDADIENLKAELQSGSKN